MRVLIAEDAALIREGIVRLLVESGFEVVGSVSDADQLLEAIKTEQPDVVIVDVRMPPTHSDEGLRAAKVIRARYPDVGVLVLSQYVELGLAGELLADGADGLGYVLKEQVANVPEFLAAVRRVGQGGSALDASIVSQLMARRRQDDRLDRLSERERVVLHLMTEGLSNQAIADRLVVTVRAVEKHVSSIFDRLGLPSTRNESRRVLAVLLFLRA
jgi:DNA-binding NarL/FixJ family response regulator